MSSHPFAQAEKPSSPNDVSDFESQEQLSNERFDDNKSKNDAAIGAERLAIKLEDFLALYRAIMACL